MKSKISCLFIAMTFVFAGCNNFETLNTDPARSSETQPEFLLGNAEKRASDLMYDTYFNGRSMDVYIAKLRKLLKEDERIEIMNVHGKGFQMLVK